MFTHLNRSIALTGVLSPPIIVNGNGYLKTSSYSVQVNQEINIDHLYLQGGPGKAVADFRNKNIQGNMSFFPRINEFNSLENSVIDLINAGQYYTSKVSLTTLLLPYNPGITAEGDPFTISSSEINSLIFDTCIVKKITIKAKENEEVKIDCEIIGQVDEPNISPISIPNDEHEIYRKLTWLDCFFSRNGSQMENLYDVEISIIKEMDQRIFLFPVGSASNDSVYNTGVKSVSVNFKYVERITSVFDLFSYSFGGFADYINFSGKFGPISFNLPNVTYKISSQNLTPDIIERTTEGFFKISPITPDNQNFVFTFN